MCQVSQMLVNYWTQFARSGDPNGGEAPAVWAALSASQPAYLEVAGPPPQMTYPTDYARRHDFWRTIFFRPSPVETQLGSIQGRPIFMEEKGGGGLFSQILTILEHLVILYGCFEH